MVRPLSLDEEQLHVRALQNPAAHSPLPLKPMGPSQISTLAPVEKLAAPQHRPVLTPPNIMWKVMDCHNKTEALTDKSAKLFDTEVTQALADIQKLETEKQEALQEEVEAAKSRATWSTLSIVAQYLSGLGLIVLGSATGGASAVLLIGAGVVGIGNRVIHDTHFLQAAVAWWTKSVELQKAITNKIEMGAFFLQMGLGLAGGVMAWQTGALAAAQINGLLVKEKAATIISGAAGVMSIGSKAGAEYYNKKIAHLQADMKEIDTASTLDYHTMSAETAAVSKMVQEGQTETDAMRQAIQASRVQID